MIKHDQDQDLESQTLRFADMADQSRTWVYTWPSLITFAGQSNNVGSGGKFLDPLKRLSQRTVLQPAPARGAPVAQCPARQKPHGLGPKVRPQLLHPAPAARDQQVLEAGPRHLEQIQGHANAT
jgi:hypothetical protein